VHYFTSKSNDLPVLKSVVLVYGHAVFCGDFVPENYHIQ